MTTARASAVRPARAALGALAAVIALIVVLPLVVLVAERGTGTAPRSPLDAVALDEWMAEQVPGSPLVGLGHVVVAEGLRTGTDPRALAAIARHESVLGTEGSGAGIHNAFGWGPGIPFASWEQDIATVARGLADGYLAKGRRTLAEIQPAWAPVGAANDPAGLNGTWLTAVGRSYADLGGDPERPITLAAQGAGIAGATTGPTGLATPTGGAGTLGGGPGEGTHATRSRPDDWQSDHAVDIGLPFGSPLYAIDVGVVAGVGGDPADLEGRFGGARLTIVTADDRYFYAHLSVLVVERGEWVARGQLVGLSGSANGATHLHLGAMRRDPRALAGLR